MASVNKVILVGNLGRDPEIRKTAEGVAVTNASIATTRRFTNAAGQQQDETEWHRVTFLGRLAEVAGEYLRKGRPVYVEGRLRTRKWEKDGQDRFTTEIIAENMQLLGGRTNDEHTIDKQSDATTKPRPAQATTQPGTEQVTEGVELLTDDIPF